MSKTIVVIGAGAGGLSAAIRLAAKGHAVTVLEMQSAAGGKMRPAAIDGETYDTGPTVLTMRWVFEELFADAGMTLSDHVNLEPLSILARHFWSSGKQLDLHADQKASEDAMGAFASAAHDYRKFSQDSARIYDTLRDTFLRKQRPTLLGLAASMPLRQLVGINPMETLWNALGRYFKSPQLRQLFGRYATYCGSSPFKAPATLMLVAAVEAQGVWRVNGGIAALASALESVAKRLGVVFHYNCAAQDVETHGGAISAVLDSDGSRHPCSHVILNADSEAAVAGLFGTAAKQVAQQMPPQNRSLSAITWCTKTPSSGADLQHHNVFFSDDYTAEFKALEHGPAQDPTIYLCAQGNNRKLILANAPANGAAAPEDIDRNMLHRLSRCGVELTWDATKILKRDPRIFAELYPATSGALYGRSSHGWTSTFQRPQARTTIPGLYLAGGYTHPGPGVPMAVLSGKLAAEALTQDLASTRRFR
jgi:1-hydroxycarotenoid 3,4-desaturase